MKQKSQRQEYKVKVNKTSGQEASDQPKKVLEEIGGPEGPEPTRYGDWEKKGRSIHF
jgi:hypothetical protein